MKKINKIVIGTNNEGKFKEICKLLPKNIKKISLKDYRIKSPPEIGKSFHENSVIKAKYFSNLLNLPCLSDDSGLEVDILGNQPGIFSSRWGGKKKVDPVTEGVGGWGLVGSNPSDNFINTLMTDNPLNTFGTNYEVIT